MKVKKTAVKVDFTCSTRKKTISLIEIEDIEAFVKAKEDSLGIRGIHLVEHEICDGAYHKLTVHQDDLDLLGEVKRTFTYEWKDYS